MESFETDDEVSMDENNYEESLYDGIVQKVTVCVQGSCYGILICQCYRCTYEHGNIIYFVETINKYL